MGECRDWSFWVWIEVYISFNKISIFLIHFELFSRDVEELIAGDDPLEFFFGEFLGESIKGISVLSGGGLESIEFELGDSSTSKTLFGGEADKFC